MEQRSKINTTDHRLKKINAAARHKANNRGKKEQAELEQKDIQMRL